MHKCNYCGLLKEYTKTDKTGKNICPSCQEIIYNNRIIVNKKERYLQSPLQIKQELDRFIIGQEEAKIMLATEAYNHLKRIKIKELDNVGKNNILFIGPSGCGKTYLVETLARIIDVPVAIVNATEFTASGYVGKNVSQIGKYLLDKANGNINLAEQGIIYIDEIDKMAGKSFKEGNKDIGGVEVQKELLKIIEGEELHVSDESDILNSLEEDIIIDTKNILFVFSGAFEGLKEDEKHISIISSKIDKVKEITPELLIANGFIKEFVGRIPLICELNALTIEDMIKILKNEENGLLEQYKRMFAYDNIDLDFTDEAISEIARLSFDKKIGARGLKAILGNVMNCILYQAIERQITKITITKEKMIKIIGKKYNILECIL